MASFIQRNKRKSALAALLLFIRTRKTVSALLLVAILASFLFVSPSSLLLHIPFGDRVAAGIAWIAGKVGMDTSKWGLAGGKHDYGDLVAAFRAAKDGGGKAGWSAFMRGGNGDGAYGSGGANGGAGGGSLDFVKGDKKDLESKNGSGEKLDKPGSVQGVVNPDDDKTKGDQGDAVALNAEEDLRGERAGFVKSAFGMGFSGVNSGFGSLNGNGGGASAGGSGNGSGYGANGSGSLGGAYAGSGFFGGNGGAASGSLGNTVKGGLSGLPSMAVPRASITGGGGRISGPHVSAVKASISRGMTAQNVISGQKAFVQLAAGNGRATLSVGNNCNADNGCPPEFAAVNTGVVYDGGKINGDGTGILTIPDQPIPAVPTDTDIPAGVDPEKMAECADAVKTCETNRQPYYRQMSQNQEQLNDIFGRMGGDCSDPCECGPCDRDKKEIHRICEGPLKDAIEHINKPCSVPSFCAELKIQPAPTPDLGPMINMCRMNTGECGPDGFFGALFCFFGS